MIEDRNLYEVWACCHDALLKYPRFSYRYCEWSNKIYKDSAYLNMIYRDEINGISHSLKIYKVEFDDVDLLDKIIEELRKAAIFYTAKDLIEL